MARLITTIIAAEAALVRLNTFTMGCSRRLVVVAQMPESCMTAETGREVEEGKGSTVDSD